MLGRGMVFASVAVSDLEQGKEFYGDTLGLETAPSGDPGGVLYSCGGGSRLLVYKSSYAGTNQATSAGWEVSDIASEIAELNAKGIDFERYEMPGVARDGDVHLVGDIKAAWFKDPDGNILSVIERV